MSGGKGKGAAAGPKLKPLVWQKVPKNRLKGTVWQDIKDSEGEGASEAEPSFDAAKFEALFAAKPPPSKPAALTRQGASSALPISVALLDPKRSNNLSIILARLKLPFDEIRKAVIDLDAEVLSHEAVGALQKCVPLQEEVELVTGAADTSTLGYAERFVLSVGTIPRLKARLECFAFKHRFNQQLHALYSDVNTLTSACQQLVSCPPLKRLLHMLLKMGNALNAGSFRSGAEGFKLECLTRLAELKSNTEQSSLLQFALAASEGRDGSSSSEPLTSFTKDLDAVRNAAKLSSTELIEEVTRLEQGLKLVCGEIEFFKKEKDKKKPSKPKEGEDGAAEDVDGGADAACERFLLVMGPFHDGASPQVSELQRASSTMGEAGGNLKSFYSEEAKASLDECLSRWATFLTQVDKAVANINEDLKKAK